MADPDRFPPPPFRRTRYFALHIMGKRGRRNIDPLDTWRALAAPYRRERQPNGRLRHWIWVPGRGYWLRVVTEADGETVHNAFWDGDFEPWIFRAVDDVPATVSNWQPGRYCVGADTMAIEVRPWPGSSDDDSIGRDAGDDLVVHCAPDGAPWL